jgi:phosphomannomutase
MGGLVVPAVFHDLPFQIEIMYQDLDGTFPNHPADPIQPENLVDLQKRVLETNADIGLAFDGDADRVFLVDEKAKPVSGSVTTALVAKKVLNEEPGATIVHNLICSQIVPETITQMGGRAVRTRVGHSYIKKIMADEQAAFGGEHSGHYYFRDNFRADSGLIAALIVLEELSCASKPLSLLTEPFSPYIASGELNIEVEESSKVIREVSKKYSNYSQDNLDGLTVQLQKCWFNLRPSNTEPLLRLNLEAEDEASYETTLQEVMDLIELNKK